jgi:cell division ATPase FtsA
MVEIICTAIICATVLLLANRLCKYYTTIANPTQQPTITQADLDKAYQEAASENVPDFQEVINFINKEFTGVTEEDDGR